MARRVKEVTITREGRDKGKTFVLTEFPADQGEWWAARVLKRVGLRELPDGVDPASGLAGLAAAGLEVLQKVPDDDIKPLLDEMMLAVRYKPEAPNAPLQSILPGEYSQIEEMATRAELRKDVLLLHIGFFTAGQ